MSGPRHARDRADRCGKPDLTGSRRPFICHTGNLPRQRAGKDAESAVRSDVIPPKGVPMEIIREPRIEQRPDLHYLGIRVVTPFRGMLKVRDELLAELYEWLPANADIGRTFLRLNVIDMNGPMDLEVGAITPERRDGDDRVRPGVLPAGNYATLTYRDHSMRANKALLEWIKDNGVTLDRRDEPEGDRFGCRYEAYVTDPRTEPRKTKWQVELNMRVAD
jgi:effector-binding domain-containing protein